MWRTLNAGLMGKMFGPLVGEVMGHVADDQKKFVQFDASKPAPKMIEGVPGAKARVVLVAVAAVADRGLCIVVTP
jgi:hypothetical protein